MINQIFDATSKDAIRQEEKKHERNIRRILSRYGIDYKPEDIRPFGLRRRQTNK